MHNSYQVTEAQGTASNAMDNHNLLLCIETRLRETQQFVEQQLREVTMMLTANRNPISMGQSSPHSSKMHLLSAVPPVGDSGQSSLLFTSETQQIFLRSALSKDLFQKLKKVAKIWLANIPEAQRNQATRIAQAVASAVTDGRINTITQYDLDSYREKIQQNFSGPYSVPTEEIRKAIVRKLRVFVQNSKPKHAEWIEKYKGYDLDAPVIVVSSSVDSPSLKRSIDSDIFLEPSTKRRKYEDETAISQEQYEDIIQHTQTEQVQWPINPPPASHLSDYQTKIILYYEQNKHQGFPRELAAASYPLVVGFCAHFKVFGVGLRELPVLLRQTCLRLFSISVNAGTMCSYFLNSIEQSNSPHINMQKTHSAIMLDEFLRKVLEQEYSYGSSHNILCILIDYALSKNIISKPDYDSWSLVLASRDLVLFENCLMKLGVGLGLPESLYHQGNILLPIVLLLMHCQLLKDPIPETFTQAESLTYSLFLGISEIVLADMCQWDNDIRSLVPPIDEEAITLLH